MTLAEQDELHATAPQLQAMLCSVVTDQLGKLERIAAAAKAFPDFFNVELSGRPEPHMHRAEGRYSPNACLSWGICAKVEISGQYAMTPMPRITPRAISNVKRDGRL
jgi:hypothetical protein